ncbi:alpha/beta hydrolase family protein [Marinicella meishanensis]|uniref:alpha/beta hydrolase family protein n=1 Tax=Marinicella meishanensis TaxID=2873263 RepID=UPI001CBD4415|nr:alpha/beta fold hydrolase [Marinicella sp. NBU2979]
MKNNHKNAPTAILFHMAGSNSMGEYTGFSHELADQGYHVLAVDTRAGGGKFNQINKTVQHNSSLENSGYCEATPDVEASIRYVREHVSKGPVILVGSSFSGALVMNAAAKYKDLVSGFVAFSPASGPPMDGCEPEEALAFEIEGMVILPDSELEYGWINQQYMLFKEHGIKTMTVEGGIHGVSTVIDDRINRDVSSLRAHIFDLMKNMITDKEKKVVFSVDDWEIVTYERSALGSKMAILFNQAAGDSKQYLSTSRKLAEANITALRVDLRGHGESNNLGIFDPRIEDSKTMLFESHNEMIQIFQYVTKKLGYESRDIYVFSASYSSDEVVKSQKMLNLDVNHFAFSPGSLSSDSVLFISQSNHLVSVIKSQNERKFFANMFQEIGTIAPNVSQKIIDGSGHGVGILEQNPKFINEIIALINL